MGGCVERVAGILGAWDGGVGSDRVDDAMEHGLVGGRLDAGVGLFGLRLLVANVQIMQQGGSECSFPLK